MYVCIYYMIIYIYDTQTYTICWYMYIHTWHVYTWFVVDYFLWSQQWEQRISDWYLFSFKAFLTLQYPRILWRITRLVPISGSNCFLDQRSLETMPVNIQFRQDLPCTNVIQIYGYGSIPINTIFRGMNIHLPAILMFTRGTRVLTHCHIMIYPDEARPSCYHQDWSTPAHLGPEVVFSWNEGQSWYDFELSSMPVEVRRYLDSLDVWDHRF